MQGRLRSSSEVQFILIQTCEKWILYFVSLFLLFIGENRLGPESSLSCPTWRAWGVPQEQGLPLLPPLCHPQLLFTPLSSHCSLFWQERKTAEDSSRDIGPSFLVLGEQETNTGPLFLALVPESEREMKTFTLLSFRVRWNLGAEPVPLLAGEHSTLCSEEIFLVIPAESAGGMGNTATCPTGGWSWLQCQLRTSGVVLHRNQPACAR